MDVSRSFGTELTRLYDNLDNSLISYRSSYLKVDESLLSNDGEKDSSSSEAQLLSERAHLRRLNK